MTRRALALLVLAAAGLPAGCAAPGAPPPAKEPPVDRAARAARDDRAALEAEARATLDDLHAAAAAADGPRYFGHFAADGVFLGTDATERWTVDAFRAYAAPHFAAGRGWTYRAVERHVGVAADGAYAWFDERLENAKLGECRGTGLLRREGGAWKVVQYDLTIPIPNALADEVVERIRAAGR